MDEVQATEAHISDNGIWASGRSSIRLDVESTVLVRLPEVGGILSGLDPIEMVVIESSNTMGKFGWRASYRGGG